MRPVRLTLQAFGSFGRKTCVDFEKTNQNLFLITGDTGAGKSTIFDAIVFALYGEASSARNKKEGTELQSQFAELKLEPYVELVFSDGEDGWKERYTVRRVPRHVRPLKRGKGTKEESGSVSLLMPDGTEYPPKETDRKIEEIVGLTKSQFMQVAMIAQGEFMELLRARSDDKKVIFRKLFHTEMFEKIVTELGNRRKEKQKEMDHLRTVCQTEISHAQIPESYSGKEEFLALRSGILAAERLSALDLERFLVQMEILYKTVKAEKEKAQDRYQQWEKLYLEKRDAYHLSVQLLQQFEQMEGAEKELKSCEAEENRIRQMTGLVAGIEAAFEVKAAYDRYQDHGVLLQEVKKRLQEQTERLPELERICRCTSAKAEEQRKLLEQKQQEFSRITDRVSKALALFHKIEEAGKQVEHAEYMRQQAASEAGLAAKRAAEAEENERKWKEEVQNLQNAEILLERVRTQLESEEELEQQLLAVRQARREEEQQRKAVREAETSFVRASDLYERKHRVYENRRRQFLNMQAGLLAREQLAEGKPCPVCGSLEHPHPCKLEEEHRELTREVLETEEKEVAELRDFQEQAAAKAKAAEAVRKEKERMAAHLSDRFREKMDSVLRQQPELSVQDSDEKPEMILSRWKERLAGCKRKCEKDADLLRDLKKRLQQMEQEKMKMREVQEQTEAARAEAETQLAAARASLESLRSSREYDNAEEAQRILAEARQQTKEMQAVFRTMQAEEERAGTARERARALIARYQKELPSREKEWEERKNVYEDILKAKGIGEDTWRRLTEEYRKEDADLLREKIHEHDKRKALARSRYETARKAAAGQQKPVPERIREERDKAMEELQTQRELLGRLEEYEKTDRGVYDFLKSLMEENGRVLAKYRKLDELYSLLSGNVTGSRMDIETFVQRYYLRRILVSANRRFTQMSSGQFELRMCEGERAGKGKNRGLDLMVYSMVTGREREVRTLSGGESFMAALSLALGMADQIQENTSSVHLDMMFIDEGFGSLDENSREKAVRVLQDMAGGTKMIGIISHVTELKQEIEDQLLVTKDEEGSHVRWQIS